MKTADERYQISSTLNESIMGFLEGSATGLADSVARRLKIPREDVRVLREDLTDPVRHCWSIYASIDGETFESVIRNMGYWTGDEG